MSLHFISREQYELVVRPEMPDWVAVNRAGAAVLRRLSEGEPEGNCARDVARTSGLDDADAGRIVANFARETRRIWAETGGDGYLGRAAYLKPAQLRELWLHVNNRCNFTCRHCLVSSDPAGTHGLPTEDLLSILAQARDLGVETFFVTGGEPLLRDDLPDLLAAMLKPPETHAVVLTNGALLGGPFLGRIAGLDRERLHLQVSLDGSTPDLNDRLRSPGSFESATKGIRRALGAGLDVTVATVVLGANLDDLAPLMQLVSGLGVKTQHLMWQHVRERGAGEQRAAVDTLAERVLELKDIADGDGIVVDNFENYLAIANGEPGVKRDLSNACWDSLAVYVDGNAYPSAALVGIDELRGGNVLESGLRAIWLEAPAFERYRRRSVLDDVGGDGDPTLYLHGGGDLDHAYLFGKLNGGLERDPYLPLYRTMIYRVIDDAVAERMALMPARDDLPFAYQLMGEDGLGCPVQAGVENRGPHRIDFAHSNCVLIQDVIGYSRRIVQDYYGGAARKPKSEICCPVQGSPRDLAHIPARLIERSYGCGSPVFAAEIGPGDTVLDLGSGSGVECFAASKRVGPTGRVIGVDMTPDMLAVARGAVDEVAGNLGYRNVEFVRAYLEALPLRDGSVDVVLSNCVINLSSEKLKVFSEIRRVLRPGGRMVISDIVSGSDVPEHVRYNPRLKSECIGGALTRGALLTLLSKLGFGNVTVAHEVPWREVEGVQFLSDTIVAERANGAPPLPYLVNLDAPAEADGERYTEGCVVCGRPVEYLEELSAAVCHFCRRELATRARCEGGHYVCDRCHGGDYMQFVRSFVAQCELTDPVEIFLQMREQFPFPLHGPEHHALVPAAFLTAYLNRGGEISPHVIEDALVEGSKLPGGTCAYWGGCSAALGIGVAYSAILNASPVKSRGRQIAQQIVARVLARMAEFRAPRCCRRETLVALQIGAEASRELLPAAVFSSASPTCNQSSLNRECIGPGCPFSP